MPDGVNVLEPDGSLQDVALLDTQTNLSATVLPSFAEEDALWAPILTPYMDSTYEPVAGTLRLLHVAVTTACKL